MPRTLVRAPGTTRTRSLGWLANAWMEFFVRHGRGGVIGLPIVHGDEMMGFVVDCYALDENGRSPYDSVFFSRPKGCDKSGLAARFALFEALGPCRFAGWAKGGEVYRDPWGLGFVYRYEPGEPMGKPVAYPMVRIMATEEGQTGNIYDSIYYNLTDDECPLSQVPGVDAGLTRVYLPGGGEIRPSTASSASKDGGLETFVALDETHIYNTPELRRMYETVTRNLLKRKSEGTWYLETTTMFAPGENSVAESTFELAEAIKEGRTRRHRLLYDHRWGECSDLTKADQLRKAIEEAFGEAIAWQDIEAIIDEFYDPRKQVADSRRYFLNAQTSASDAWLTAQEWAACASPDKHLVDGDLVTLGLDGAVRDDAVALVGCRISDGHLELLGFWQKPADYHGDDWRVDTIAVDAAVAKAMARFRVAAFYMDPPYMQELCDKWTAEYGEQMQVKATQGKPLEWWTNRPRAIVSALERFYEAVRALSVSYTPDYALDDEDAKARASTLRTHLLNARRRVGRAGITISKDYPKSSKKIDGAMAAVLSYEARGDCVAAGVGGDDGGFVPVRVR
ncbi:hypothetical protein ACIBTV_27315 [Micromonospora sp. NPDC049366]|uniref:hypothetical protein n=1 Tax=Micromonospora sp. NPDC049366 TaxID=3364271 RepID=UPI0037B6AE37